MDEPIILPMTPSDPAKVLERAREKLAHPGIAYPSATEIEAATAEPPQLLRVPTSFHSVDDVLGAAAKMDLPNCIVISERESGALVLLATDMSLAHTNWLLDRLKAVMLAPDQPMRAP